jgi:ATPase subunit of ABC transporter with duplicated ATPase domains
MPSFDFTHTWNAPETFRALSVIGTYDLREVKLEKHIRGSIPIEGLQWQIGAIVGASGSGKTSIAKHCWPKAYYADLKDRYKSASFLDDFPENLTVKEVDMALCSSGFSEPPSWLKSYSVLSQGQKMRVDIAMALCLPQNLIVFDEFTSTVDRTVAQIGSLAVSKAVRKHPGKQFIAVSCHSDILDWLEPDWVYNVDSAEFFNYLDVKKNDLTQPSIYRFINAIYPYGRCLGCIII